jgi:hypothetical protein
MLADATQHALGTIIVVCAMLKHTSVSAKGELLGRYVCEIKVGGVARGLSCWQLPALRHPGQCTLLSLSGTGEGGLILAGTGEGGLILAGTGEGGLILGRALLCVLPGYVSAGMPGSGHGRTCTAFDTKSHTARAVPDGSAARPIICIPSSVCM